jgi:hypothetical protein
MIRDVGWVTREAQPYWENTDDINVAFFRRRNPGFHNGQGLLTLVPMTPYNVLYAAVHWGLRKGRPSSRR